MDEWLDFIAGDTRPHTLAVIRAQVLAWGRFAKDAKSAPPINILGFSTPGQFRRALVARLLNEAARHFKGSAWARAGKLAEAIRVFEVRRWPKYRRELVAPDCLGAVDRLLFDVFRLSERLPRTQRGLFNLID